MERWVSWKFTIAWNTHGCQEPRSTSVLCPCSYSDSEDQGYVENKKQKFSSSAKNLSHKHLFISFSVLRLKMLTHDNMMQCSCLTALFILNVRVTWEPFDHIGHNHGLSLQFKQKVIERKPEWNCHSRPCVLRPFVSKGSNCGMDMCHYSPANPYECSSSTQTITSQTCFQIALFPVAPASYRTEMQAWSLLQSLTFAIS